MDVRMKKMTKITIQTFLRNPESVALALLNPEMFVLFQNASYVLQRMLYALAPLRFWLLIV